MKKLLISGTFVCLATLFLLFGYASREKAAIASSVLRLHIVAESNSEEDQKLKLKVRDTVLREAAAIFAGAENKEEAMYLARENEELFIKAAEATLKNEGCISPVTLSIGKTVFPCKEYENIRLPGGIYDAVNVKIGKAEGENWWCIMYPMLCFTDSVSSKLDTGGEAALKKELGEERFSLISETDDKKINIKFKILELF